jgi:hypothetical protein
MRAKLRAAMEKRGLLYLRSYEVDFGASEGVVLYYATNLVSGQYYGGTINKETLETQVRMLKGSTELDPELIAANAGDRVVLFHAPVEQSRKDRLMYIGPEINREMFCNYSDKESAEKDLPRIVKVWDEYNGKVFVSRVKFFSRPDYPNNQWCAEGYMWAR